MTSFFAGLALLVVGVVSALYGYRLFRILLPVFGGVFGFVTAWGWWGDSAWLLAVVAGVAFAVILGALAYGLWSLYVGMAGVVFGLALASIIATSLNMSAWLAIPLAAVLAVVFGYLFVKIRNEAVIIATATVGAATAARGVAEWFGLQAGFAGMSNPNPTWLNLLMIAIFVVVGALGLAVQWNNYRLLKLYDKPKASEDQAAPATATRSTSAPLSAGGAGAVSVPAAVAVAGAAALTADKLAEPEPPVAEVVETPVEAVAVAGAAVVAGEKLAEPEAPVAAAIAAPVEAVAEVVEAPAEAAAVAAAAVVAGEKLAEPEARPAEVVETPVEAAVEAVSGAEEIAVERLAGTGGAPVVLGAAIANEVEETVPSEDAAPAGAEAAEPVAANIVDAVVKEIEQTYSYEDIAKFKEKLEFVEGIGPVYAEKLREAGINIVLDLLQRGATRKGRLELVEATGIASKLILRWVNHADLYRVKGVGSEYADLLEMAGVDTVVELAKRNPANLLNAMTETNKVRQLVRKEPVASQVEAWVAQAKQLPRVIQY